MPRGGKVNSSPYKSWTVVKLRSALISKGIPLHGGEKKASLLRLWEFNNVSAMGDSSRIRRNAAGEGRGRGGRRPYGTRSNIPAALGAPDDLAMEDEAGEDQDRDFNMENENINDAHKPVNTSGNPSAPGTGAAGAGAMTTEEAGGLATCIAQAVIKYIDRSRKEDPQTSSNKETGLDTANSPPLNSAPAGSHLDTSDVTANAIRSYSGSNTRSPGQGTPEQDQMTTQGVLRLRLLVAISTPVTSLQPRSQATLGDFPPLGHRQCQQTNRPEVDAIQLMVRESELLWMIVSQTNTPI
jgi:hypothetical protein